MKNKKMDLLQRLAVLLFVIWLLAHLDELNEDLEIVLPGTNDNAPADAEA